MSDRTMLVFHVLRNYPPSNLNRGEKGAPKDCMFGGVRRGRISSQSLKRAIRISEPFDVFRDAGLIDLRTRYLPTFISDELTRRGVEHEKITDIINRIHELSRKAATVTEDAEEGEEVEPETVDVDAKKGKAKKEKSGGLTTKQLVRCAPQAISELCDQLLELQAGPKWKKNLEEVIKKVNIYGVDTALFGSMTTSAAFPFVNSACQVSHAFSVNKTQWERDYFTAVDDWASQNDSDAGAGMVGNTPFNSNAYYWSIAVNLDILTENLQGDTGMVKEVLEQLVKAIFIAHPGGKQNTFFAQPQIGLFLAEKRKSIVMDYSNAFEQPIAPDEKFNFKFGSLMTDAIGALEEYIPKVDGMYELPVERRHVSLFNVNIPQSEQMITMGEISKWVASN